MVKSSRSGLSPSGRLPCVLSALVLIGCGQRDPAERQPIGLSIAEVHISPDEHLETEAGHGVGLFVGTDGAGLWELLASCDSELSGYLCDWDVVVSVPSSESLSDVAQWDDEGLDVVYRIDGGAVQWLTVTGDDFDGLSFKADAGQTVRLDVLLDGVSAPDFIYWSDRGITHAGAPSDPVDFVPR